MKICDKCGAEQADGKFFCNSCGEELSGSLTDKEAEDIKRRNAEKLDESYIKADPLYISTGDKITGILAAAGAVVALIIIILNNSNISNMREVIYSITFFVLCSIDALFPKPLWELEKLRLSFWVRNADDLEPSEFYFIGRRLTVYGFFVIAILILLYSLVKFKYLRY